MKKLLVLIGLMIGGCGGVRAVQMDADGVGITPTVKGQDDASLDRRKIVIVTDPHVMAPELLVNEGTAWENYLKVDRKLVDYSRRLFDEMIARIKSDLRPGLVLMTGDMTKDGELLSHQYVVSKLDELRAVGIKTLVIPGNHDRGNNINAL